MLLNCDLGEGLDDVDTRVMPLIELANIACGGHAGDAHSMKRCVDLALKYNVRIGAHPAYPDRTNFGRRRPDNLTPESLTSALQAQLAALQRICDQANTQIAYVKPHGALYHDVAHTPWRLEALLTAMSRTCPGIPLMLQAQPQGQPPPAWQPIQAQVQTNESLPTSALWTEAFADRAYLDSGHLVSRDQPGAVLASATEIFQQAQTLIRDRRVKSITGNVLEISADSVCVHGDTPAAYEALQRIQTWRTGQYDDATH